MYAVQPRQRLHPRRAAVFPSDELGDQDDGVGIALRGGAGAGEERGGGEEGGDARDAVGAEQGELQAFLVGEGELELG